MTSRSTVMYTVTDKPDVGNAPAHPRNMAGIEINVHHSDYVFAETSSA